MKQATANAMETMSKLQKFQEFTNYVNPLAAEGQKMFEIENKVRMIVADMLINMDDKLNKQIRELKSTQTEIHHVNMRVVEVNTKLDREAKLRDLVDNLKAKIGNLVSIHSFLFNFLIDDIQEKGMA